MCLFREVVKVVLLYPARGDFYMQYYVCVLSAFPQSLAKYSDMNKYESNMWSGWNKRDCIFSR